MAEIPVHKSSGNVFADIGFTPAEAAELTAKSSLISAIDETIKRRKLTQLEAARRCGTDQPTLSKVLRGRMESVTIDRLTAWLTSLGRTVEIRVRPYDSKAEAGRLVSRDHALKVSIRKSRRSQSRPT
jgi:predicted XRE-type DNA-binding protein